MLTETVKPGNGLSGLKCSKLHTVLVLNSRMHEGCVDWTLLHHFQIYCKQLLQYFILTHPHSLQFASFLCTDWKTDKNVLYSHLSADCCPPACSAYRWEPQPVLHLQHFPQIQIPGSIISPLHSDVLPFIPALYYRQLSPVLERRKQRFFCLCLAGHLTDVVSPYRLRAPQRQLSVTPAANRDTMATRSLPGYF